MFKKFFLFLASFFLLFHVEGMHPKIVDEQGEVSPLLLNLLDLCSIEHDSTLTSIVNATQKEWYQGGKERWEFEERFQEIEPEVLNLLQKMKLLGDVLPDQQYYDYVFVHGGLHSRAKGRFSSVSKLYLEGVRFGKIIVLSGERILDPVLEKELLGELNTEIEMMRFVASQSLLPEVPVEFVSAKSRDGRRPTTKDTIEEWLKTNPKPGSCLAISNQPFVGYQNAVVKTYLPRQFSLCTVGGAAEKTKISVHLDNLARWLYQEKIYLGH